MWSNLPDDEIADTVEVSTAAQLRACADPLRMTLLDLVPFGPPSQSSKSSNIGHRD